MDDGDGKIFVRKIGEKTMIIGIINLIVQSVCTELLYGVVIESDSEKLTGRFLEIVIPSRARDIDDEMKKMGANARIFFRNGFAKEIGEEVTIILMTAEEFPSCFDDESIHAVRFEETLSGFSIQVGAKQKTEEFYRKRADQILCEL